MPKTAEISQIITENGLKQDAVFSGESINETAQDAGKYTAI